MQNSTPSTNLVRQCVVMTRDRTATVVQAARPVQVRPVPTRAVRQVRPVPFIPVQVQVAFQIALKEDVVFLTDAEDSAVVPLGPTAIITLVYSARALARGLIMEFAKETVGY